MSHTHRNALLNNACASLVTIFSAPLLARDYYLHRNHDQPNSKTVVCSSVEA
jgi:hypothetical protein